MKKLQEDADLELAKDAFGKTGSGVETFFFIKNMRSSTKSGCITDAIHLVCNTLVAVACS